MKTMFNPNSVAGQRERGGVVIERRAPNLEVLPSTRTGVTVLCP